MSQIDKPEISSANKMTHLFQNLTVDRYLAMAEPCLANAVAVIVSPAFGLCKLYREQIIFLWKLMKMSLF